MRILCFESDNSARMAYYDSDYFKNARFPNVPFYEVNVDEVDPANIALCRAIERKVSKGPGVNGECAYYGDPVTLELLPNLDWQEPERGEDI